MNRSPIPGLALTIPLAPTLTAPPAAATPEASAQAANSQPKPGDAFFDVNDFGFGNGESLASLVCTI